MAPAFRVENYDPFSALCPSEFCCSRCKGALSIAMICPSSIFITCAAPPGFSFLRPCRGRVYIPLRAFGRSVRIAILRRGKGKSDAEH